MRKPDVVCHLVGVAVVEVDVTVRLHAGVPHTVLAIGVLAVEVNELGGVGRQALEDVQLVTVGVHDAQAILVLGEDVGEELVGEVGLRGLLNEKAHGLILNDDD